VSLFSISAFRCPEIENRQMLYFNGQNRTKDKDSKTSEESTWRSPVLLGPHDYR